MDARIFSPPPARATRAYAATAAVLAIVAVSLEAPVEPRMPVRATAAHGDVDGRDTRVPPSRRPTVEAAFSRESYAAGDLARLVIWTRGRRTSLQVFQAGTERGAILARDVMLGSPVTARRRVGDIANGDTIGIRIGPWRSGLYFAKLTAAGGKIGYAPFVLRPRRLGEHTVAVVLPTMTWQAYNFHDDDGDGVPDTWYQDQNDHRLTARLNRPYENRGVIPHYKYYDEPFIRWLAANHPDVDFLADADVDAATTSGRKLAAAYELLVFPGHHEYVTRHEYDVVTAFRNLGGNLMFLSANNFYRNTVKRGNVMHREARWRDVGRPEAALVGTEYFGNDSGEHRGPWIVRRTRVSEWLFAGTRLWPGSRFASGGIEGDEVTPSSPRSTVVVASIPNLFGTGHAADMTYYETPGGAKVFAAGAFTIAGAVWWKDVGTVLENLWRHLGDDRNRYRF
jgi:hypothetical protein